MISLADALQKRIEAYSQKGADALEWEKKEYNKRWSEGVQHFQKAVNEDRRREGRRLPPVSFVVVRSKLAHIRNIEDLRWFYFQCKRYSKTKDKEGNWNTFSKCFFGSLKVR